MTTATHTYLRMMRPRPCLRCGVVFRVLDELGMHRCQAHTGDQYADGTWKCCGRRDHWGCTDVDHCNEHSTHPCKFDLRDLRDVLSIAEIDLDAFGRRPGVRAGDDGKVYVSTVKS